MIARGGISRSIFSVPDALYPKGSRFEIWMPDGFIKMAELLAKKMKKKYTREVVIGAIAMYELHWAYWSLTKEIEQHQAENDSDQP